MVERRILKPKRLLNVDQEEIDPRKKEIEDLNRKLNRLFDKMRTGAITTRDTYVYSTIGLDPLRPVRICSLLICTFSCLYKSFFTHMRSNLSHKH